MKRSISISSLILGLSWVVSVTAQTAPPGDRGVRSNAPQPTAPNSEVAPTPASTPAPAPVAPPDLVRLKNGGLLRGTIAELVADKELTILLITGERRTIPMAEVVYAGPAAQAPQTTLQPTDALANDKVKPIEGEASATGPSVTTNTNDVKLTLEADEPNITFYVHGAGASGQSAERNAFTRICTAPCEASLAQGAYELALSGPDHSTRVAIEAQKDLATIALNGPTKLRGHFESRADVRSTAMILGGLAVLGGLVLAATATSDERQCVKGVCVMAPQTNEAQLYGGAALSTAGLVTAIVVPLVVKDKAVIAVSPGAPTSAPTPGIGNAPSASRLWNGLAGAQLVGRF